MTTSTEKLTQLAQLAGPLVDQLPGQDHPLLAMGLAYLAPLLEAGALDAALAEIPAATIDDTIAVAIDLLGRLRSDDAPALVVDRTGASYAADPSTQVVGDGAGIVASIVAAVSGPDLRGGDDGIRQERAGTLVVLDGGAAPSGDRPGRQ